MTLREPTALGDVLRTAREAKFIDLARVERDTKIHARYLAALEHGEYRDLPGGVYTKGFVRNYGLYLGLDPGHLLDLYRREQAVSARRSDRSPGRRSSRIGSRSSVTLTPPLLAGIAVALLVVGFSSYLVVEFLTFAQTPTLSVTDPKSDVGAWGSDHYLIRGLTEPRAAVSISGLAENPTVLADAEGMFAVEVLLLPGANVVSVVAHDPRTGRDSATLRRAISVVMAEPSASPPGGAP